MVETGRPWVPAYAGRPAHRRKRIVGMPPDVAWTPLRLTIVWLVGTLIVFFLTAAAEGTPGVFQLLLVAGGGIATFALGYSWKVRRTSDWSVSHNDESPPRALIVLSCMWAIGYGYFVTRAWLMSDSLVDAIRNPGLAYRLKNDALSAGETTSTSRGAQLVYLTAGLQTLFLPLGILWWRQLGWTTRTLVVVAAIGAHRR